MQLPISRCIWRKLQHDNELYPPINSGRAPDQRILTVSILENSSQSDSPPSALFQAVSLAYDGLLASKVIHQTREVHDQRILTIPILDTLVITITVVIRPDHGHMTDNSRDGYPPHSGRARSANTDRFYPRNTDNSALFQAVSRAYGGNSRNGYPPNSGSARSANTNNSHLRLSGNSARGNAGSHDIMRITHVTVIHRILKMQ